MKQTKKKKNVLNELYDLIQNFQLIGILVVQNIMNYLDSPGLYKFFNERYIKFHELGCYNFDESERYNDKKRMKFIKWLHFNLADFLSLIYDFRKTEEELFELISKDIDNESIYNEINKSMPKMQGTFKKIAKHKIQVVDDKLNEIREDLVKEKVDIQYIEEFAYLNSKFENINQAFITSIIELFPEILSTNIEDIMQDSNEDFYYNDECENMDFLETLIIKLK